MALDQVLLGLVKVYTICNSADDFTLYVMHGGGGGESGGGGCNFV